MYPVRDGQSPKQQLQQRKGALWSERSSWIRRYQDISDYLLPYAGRFFSQDRNRGDRTFNNIYDETATYALDVLAAGLMAGMTSPARPWFQLKIADQDLMEFQPVKQWLARVAQMMRDIFNKSNTYNSLHLLYEELGAFGTGVSIVEPDFENVLHHTPLTAGEYAISTNSKGVPNTLAREFDMTVAQIVEKFVYDDNYNNKPNWSAVSPTVKNMWDTHKNMDKWMTIIHLIEPRCDYDRSKLDAKNMPFASCYFEPGRDNGDEKLLRESGYRNFPALAPRWTVRGGDIYGSAPSFRVLGSIKQLQHQQLRKAQGIDYMVKPPLQAPAELRNKGTNFLPGGVSYVSNVSQAQGIKAAFEVKLPLGELKEDMQEIRQRIRTGFYADLFLLFVGDDRNQPATATEVVERQEEKLLMLGPTLQRLHGELLGPKIDITFNRLVEVGILPIPPQALDEMPLSVEFVSPLAQAQKMVGLGAVDRLLGMVGQVAQVKGNPSVWDKIDTDQTIDRYADMLGTDPTIVRSDDAVEEIRAFRQQQMQQQQQVEQAEAAAGAAKDLGSIDTSKPNALTDILRQVQGYNATV